MDIDKLPIIAFSILVLFVCGGLYLIGFWTTFNLNIGSLISFADVPKAFILPLFSIFGYILISNIANYILSYNPAGIYPQDQVTFKNKALSWIYQNVKSRHLVYLSLSLAIGFYFIYNSTVGYWFFFTQLLAATSWAMFIRDHYVRLKYPNNYLRRSVGAIIIIFPILSFGSGKIDSINIYLNKNIKVFCVKDSMNHSTDTLKVVSLLSDKVIAASLDNQKLVVMTFPAEKKIELFDLKDYKI